MKMSHVFPREAEKQLGCLSVQPLGEQVLVGIGEGFLGAIGLVLSIIASSVALFCAVGLGASVALRKKGKSKLSFAVQFAGFAGIILMLLIFFLCYGNLLATIN